MKAATTDDVTCGGHAISWAPEVKVDGVWSRNALRFATREEAERRARNLFCRWLLATDSRATAATEPVNYCLTDGGDLVEVKP